MPPYRIQKDFFFLEKSHILTPNRDSQESHLAKSTFFRVSLVAHVYSTSIFSPHLSIQVPPPRLCPTIKIHGVTHR